MALVSMARKRRGTFRLIGRYGTIGRRRRQLFFIGRGLKRRRRLLFQLQRRLLPAKKVYADCLGHKNLFRLIRMFPRRI